MFTAQTTQHDIAIPTFDGIQLRGWHWLRPEPQGVVVIAHGFGEHGGCYRHVAEALGPPLEVDVVAPDFRGHGRSPGRRGVVVAYEDLVADLRCTVEWAARARPGLPLFVLGHSNGGQVALRFALERPGALAGLVVSNPSLRLATRVPRYKVAIGHWLRRHAPSVTLSATLPASRLTRDPAMQREHQVDPLRHNRMSAPLFFGMVEGGTIVAERAQELQVPTLVLLGASDPVIDPETTREAFDRITIADKTLHIYPKMLHEPLNELGREQVFADIIAWLDTHLRTSGR